MFKQCFGINLTRPKMSLKAARERIEPKEHKKKVEDPEKTSWKKPSKGKYGQSQPLGDLIV
jgi:hypothetical protein